MQMTSMARRVGGLVPVALPRPREAHCWYINTHEVRDESLLSSYLELLSPCEKRDILCMNDSNLKKRALLARVLLRTTLSRYTNCQVNPVSLKFSKNKFGKPELVWQHQQNWKPPPLHFNMSHSSSLIACGVTVNVPIGIDVEEKERKIKNSIANFSKRYFTTQESEFLNMFSDPEIQRQEFIKLWTLKEAYVKALGRGFSAAPFRTFTIRIKAKSRQQMEAGDTEVERKPVIVVEDVDDPAILTTNWHFLLFELADSHYSSMCIQKGSDVEGEGSEPFRLQAWRTIPLVEDDCVSPQILL